jgi:hypothetical protein
MTVVSLATTEVTSGGAVVSVDVTHDEDKGRDDDNDECRWLKIVSATAADSDIQTLTSNSPLPLPPTAGAAERCAAAPVASIKTGRGYGRVR